VYGGIIQKVRGAVGTFNSKTKEKRSGYEKNYFYDERLMSLAPPRYPTTGSYQITIWQDQGVTQDQPDTEPGATQP
jgi:hypothetical protein